MAKQTVTKGWGEKNLARETRLEREGHAKCLVQSEELERALRRTIQFRESILAAGREIT